MARILALMLEERRRRCRSGPTAIGVGILLALARPTAIPSIDPDLVPAAELTREEWRAWTELIATDAERAYDQLADRIAGGAQDCTTYALVVEAARQAGAVTQLGRDLSARLRRHPDDLHLVVGYATVLDAVREHARSRNLLARAVRQHVPCAKAYELFIRTSQLDGRLSEAEHVLRSQTGASAWLSYGRGLVDETRGEHANALAAYQNALLRPATPSEAYYRGAELLELTGDFERALGWADQGIAVARARGAFTTLSRLLGRKAGLLYRDGRVEESFDCLNRALELGAREPQWVVNVLLRHAYLASARGDHDRAIELFERARSVELDGLRDELVAQATLRLGKSYLSASDLEPARASFAESLDHARASGDAFAVWDAELGLAQVDLMDGFAYRALESITSLLERSLELDDAPRQTAAVETAATIYERLGSFDRALELYRLTLRRTELQRDLSRQALTLANIAIVEMRLGLGAAALAHAEQAARLAPLARDRRLETGLLQSLAAALAGAGRLDEARDVYAQALATVDERSSSELYGLIHSGLGRVLLALGDIGSARERFRAALAAPGGASGLVRLQALSGLGLAAWRQGELTEALEQLDKSLDLVESSRQSIATEGDRLRYQETRFTIYANLAGVLTELDERHPESGYAERAFAVIERSRARALLDVLERSGPATATPRLAGLADGARILEEGELFIAYALGEERSTLWAISVDGLHRYSLPSRRDIEREVVRYLQTIRTPPRAPSNPFAVHREPAASLYRILIEPAEELLQGAHHVIVAPHGILHHLPFETLGKGDDDADFRYLVEDHVFSYVPSLSVLTELRQRSPRVDTVGLDFVGFAQSRPKLAVAVPGTVLLPIPFADEEIAAASTAFTRGRFELIHGERATETRLKHELARSHRIVHIAAHALADRSRPDRSAIFVGRDELGYDDGLLSMREVLALPIACDVVVLSGCETGLGQVMEIEGTLGFTWAFLSSGASTVAVTLWNVNDRASARLVEAFYDGVGAGRSLAEALAEAKRDMLHSTRRAYRHPYFWAPMIVVGRDRERAFE